MLGDVPGEREADTEAVGAAESEAATEADTLCEAPTLKDDV